MKILTNESESSQQGLTHPAQSITSRSSSRANIFQNLILSASSDPERRVSKSDSSKILDFIKNNDIKRTDSQPIDINQLVDSNLDDSDPILAQLNMINQRPLKDPLDEKTTDVKKSDNTGTAQKDSQLTFDTQATAVISDVAPALVPTTVVTADPSALTDLSVMGALVVTPDAAASATAKPTTTTTTTTTAKPSTAITSATTTLTTLDTSAGGLATGVSTSGAVDSNAATAQSSSLTAFDATTTRVPDTDLAVIKNNSQPVANEVQNRASKLSDLHLRDNDIKGMNPSQLGISFLGNDSTQVPTSLMTEIPLPNENQYEIPQNKVSDAMAQLGSMINAQTGRDFSISDQSMSGVLNSASGMETATTHRSTYHPDYDLQIELAKASPDALKNEAYNAKIKIYPPELGHVLAKLRMDKNSAELMIVTENAHVKQIIESNIAQLRENFQKSDINLTTIQVHVQDSQSGNSSFDGKNFNEDNSRSSNNKSIIADEKQTSTTYLPKVRNGLVDTYV